jgi:23S rRNA (uracil1939-C5)-methyltransferase
LSRKRKNETLLNIKIDTYAAEGKSIARLESGKVLFVENTVPGDVVDVAIIKSKKDWAEGKLKRLVTPSPLRTEPFCRHFGICGGCKWQNLPYSQQLVYKQQQVIDQLTRIGHLTLPEVSPIIGSKQERFYRNKLEFTFSEHRYHTFEEIAERHEKFEREPVLGFHAPSLFDKVVEIHTCYLQGEPTNLLLEVLRTYCKKHDLEFYDYKKMYGWLRNVVLRVSTNGQILINVVFHHEDQEKREQLLQHLIEKIPNITSLNYTLNPKVNDTIYDREVICYYGESYIEEHLEQFTFKISPKSFFQTNTGQAETLYRVVRNFAGMTGKEILYDLYCGTGSIGIFCSAMAKSVIGIETVEDAITDAKQNAAANGLTNCHFFAGDVINICTDDFFSRNGKPDVVVTDPPRAGMHPKMIAQILKIRAPRVVYVSCNPATQARDLHELIAAYNITQVQPFDMFPHTHHIENVVLLELKKEE